MYVCMYVRVLYVYDGYGGKKMSGNDCFGKLEFSSVAVAPGLSVVLIDRPFVNWWVSPLFMA